MFRKRYGGLKMPVTSHWLFFTVFYACSSRQRIDQIWSGWLMRTIASGLKVILPGIKVN